MSPQPTGRLGGPGRSALPYEVLAGVEPCRSGWLVVAGNLQGITLAPQPAFVSPTLADVLDYRPSFSVIAVHASVGVPDKPGDHRACDVAARALLGRHGATVVAAPSRALLAATSFAQAREIDPSVDVVRWATLRRTREAVEEVASWRQRFVWETHPELAFRSMNEGRPLNYSRRSVLGAAERAELLEAKLPGSSRVLEARPRGVEEWRLLAALADLWLARRVKAHAITRMADPPEWDAEGVRMDLVC